MKKLLKTIFLLVILGLILTYYENIFNFVVKDIVYKDELTYDEPNAYKKDYDFNFVKQTTDFEPENKQDIMNIIYTMLNDGYEDFTFFCPKKYENCLTDVQDIINDRVLISNINNFVSPYNSYNKINVNLNNFGRVNIVVDKLYSNELISKISSKIDELYAELINDSMTDREKIKTIHDYIINRTSYDEERSEEVKKGEAISLKHTSNLAYGPLFTGKAICGGYSDAMALFLDKMGIKNYKISSSSHIWNLVYIDGSWKHLDLTWDDPVLANGESAITDIFFLISTDELYSKNTSQHIFDENVFSEAKKNS